jgi:hypothetical protein
MKTNNASKVVMVLGFLGTLGMYGCSAKVSTSTPGPIDIPGGISGAPISIQAPAPAAPTALEGKWKLACTALSPQAYAVGEIDFKGNVYSSTMTLFQDSQCTATMGDAQTDFGSFVIPAAGQVNLTSGAGATTYNVYEIDNQVLYTGLQPSTDAASRPQSVDRDLGFTYSGAPVIDYSN